MVMCWLREVALTGSNVDDSVRVDIKGDLNEDTP